MKKGPIRVPMFLGGPGEMGARCARRLSSGFALLGANAALRAAQFELAGRKKIGTRNGSLCFLARPERLIRAFGAHPAGALAMLVRLSADFVGLGSNCGASRRSSSSSPAAKK
jgi:hypothetical protein